MDEVPLYAPPHANYWAAFEASHGGRHLLISAGERRVDNFNGFKDFRTENGSSQGQNLALTGLFVPSSLDSGGS